jgi:hypothetical protein
MKPRAFASLRSRSAREYSTDASNRTHYRDGFTAGYEAAHIGIDALAARNEALVAALKNIRKQPRSPRGGFSGFVDRIVEMIDAALAAEERAAKAAKES